MTVKTSRDRNNYLGTGLLSDYAYQFTMEFETWFVVKIRTISTGAVETLANSSTAGFIVLSGIGDVGGGNIQLRASSAPRLLTSDEELAIVRRVPDIQDSDIRNQGDSFPERLEDAHDFRTYVTLQNADGIGRSIKVGDDINTTQPLDTGFVDMTLPTPKALQFIRWNATANGWENADIGDAGAIGLPGVNGIAVYLGSNNFTARTFTTTGDIAMTNPDGVSAAPDIDSTIIDNKVSANTTNITANTAAIAVADPFEGTEQDTPNNTVKLTGGTVAGSAGAKAIVVAAGSADSITFPSVSGNSRIDVLSINPVTGVPNRAQGTESASPVPPAYPNGNIPLYEVTVDETGTVTINNADLKLIKTSLNTVTNNADWSHSGVNLNIKSAIAVDVAAGFAVRDFTGQYIITSDTLLAMDITNSVGALGLNKGTEASSTRYLVIIVSKSSDPTDTTAVFVAEADYPSSFDFPAGGFDIHRRFYPAINDSSSDFVEGRVIGGVFTPYETLTIGTITSSSFQTFNRPSFVGSEAEMISAFLTTGAIVGSASNTTFIGEEGATGSSGGKEVMFGNSNVDGGHSVVVPDIGLGDTGKFTARRSSKTVTIKLNSCFDPMTN